MSVVTTERGLPVALRIHDSELAKPPQLLARQIMVLCQLSAAEAQVRRRRELTESGFGSSVIRGLRLASEEDLAILRGVVYGEDDDDDEQPPTWLRPT
jgi:hypothetical protein